MGNQYTKKEYSYEEICYIINEYKNGVSYTKIGEKLKRQKNNIKQILIENNAWIENKNKLKKEFSNSDIDLIIKKYNEGYSIKKIHNEFGFGVTPIKRILIENSIIRRSKSNGKKIILNNDLKNQIKDLYLNKYESILEISEKTGLTTSFIDKYLRNVEYRRNKSEATSISSVRKYSGIPYNEYLINLSEYKKYRKKVINITNKQPIKNLPNYDKRGNYKNINAYHLDHKYSISEGFKNDILPEIIGNIENLEFIPWEDNLKKKNKCSITINELINK
jgi:hypothetical protein